MSRLLRRALKNGLRLQFIADVHKGLPSGGELYQLSPADSADSWCSGASFADLPGLSGSDHWPQGSNATAANELIWHASTSSAVQLQAEGALHALQRPELAPPMLGQAHVVRKPQQHQQLLLHESAVGEQVLAEARQRLADALRSDCPAPDAVHTLVHSTAASVQLRQPQRQLDMPLAPPVTSPGRAPRPAASSLLPWISAEAHRTPAVPSLSAAGFWLDTVDPGLQHVASGVQSSANCWHGESQQRQQEEQKDLQLQARRHHKQWPIQHADFGVNSELETYHAPKSYTCMCSNQRSLSLQARQQHVERLLQRNQRSQAEIEQRPNAVFCASGSSGQGPPLDAHYASGQTHLAAIDSGSNGQQQHLHTSSRPPLQPRGATLRGLQGRPAPAAAPQPPTWLPSNEPCAQGEAAACAPAPLHGQQRQWTGTPDFPQWLLSKCGGPGPAPAPQAVHSAGAASLMPVLSKAPVTPESEKRIR